MKQKIIGTVAILAGVLTFAAGTAGATQKDDDGEHKVWVCHATAGEGELKNGYDLIHVDVASTKGEAHLAHATTDPKTNKKFGDAPDYLLYDYIDVDPNNLPGKCALPKEETTTTVKETTTTEGDDDDTTTTTVEETTTTVVDETTTTVQETTTTEPETTVPETTEPSTTTTVPDTSTTTVVVTTVPPTVPPTTPPPSDLPKTGGNDGVLLLAGLLLVLFGLAFVLFPRKASA